MSRQVFVGKAQYPQMDIFFELIGKGDKGGSLIAPLLNCRHSSISCVLVAYQTIRTKLFYQYIRHHLFPRQSPKRKALSTSDISCLCQLAPLHDFLSKTHQKRSPKRKFDGTSARLRYVDINKYAKGLQNYPFG